MGKSQQSSKYKYGVAMSILDDERTTIETYEIPFVPYMSFEAMIQAGGYDQIGVNEELFPLLQEAIPQNGKLQINLVCFHRYTPSVTPYLIPRCSKFRLASLQELCAIGSALPELQREFPIIALDSPCRSSHGLIGSPFLGGDVNRRFISVHWESSNDVFRPDYRFLTVK